MAHLFVKKNFIQINVTKFDLIIDLQSKFRNSLILKRIPHTHFYSNSFKNLFSTKKIEFKSKNHLDNLNIFLETKIKKISFDFNKLPKNLLNEAKRLLPKNKLCWFFSNTR